MVQVSQANTAIKRQCRLRRLERVLLYRRPLRLNIKRGTEHRATDGLCRVLRKVRRTWLPFQSLRVLDALSISISFRVVALLSVCQQSTGRDSEKSPQTSVAYHRLAFPGLYSSILSVFSVAIC